MTNLKKKTFSLAWGANEFGGPEESAGFDAEDGFDSFLAMRAPPEVRFTKSILNRIFFKNFNFFVS